MIVFIIGTTAEALKLKTLWSIFEEKKIPHIILNLGQHPSGLMSVCKEEYERSRIQDLRASTSSDLAGVLTAFSWFLKSVIKAFKLTRGFTPIEAIIVQGDTLSTLVGAIVGKILRLEVVHVEAGLRSGKIFHPFPEEITRRLVTKLSTRHLVPSVHELNNLVEAGVDSKNVANTFLNTSIDILPENVGPRRINQDYVVVTLHRHELLRNRVQLKNILEEIESLSQYILIYLVLDTRARLASSKIWKHSHENLKILDKIPHDIFINFVTYANWVLTDSGGLQEECAFLGVPTLVHRVATERFEGVGENIHLNSWKKSTLLEFHKVHSTYRRLQLVPPESPSLLCWRALVDWNIV